MIEILVQRLRSDQHRTHGDIFLDGEHQCVSLEDVVREDPNPDTPHNEAKVYGQTAIPAGCYQLRLRNSPTFGPDTLELVGVPGYSDVLIHGGNTELNTKGCILTGMVRAAASILRSQEALKALKAKVVPRLKAGEEGWITVRDAA